MSDQKIIWRKNKAYISFERWQATFNEKAKLEIQIGLMSRISRQKINIKQLTIDQWLAVRKDDSSQQLKHEEKPKRVTSIEIPKTITCIELAMKHDKRGFLIDWMKGEPQLESWDGSIDNKERILENHVSKCGWEF